MTTQWLTPIPLNINICHLDILNDPRVIVNTHDGEVYKAIFIDGKFYHENGAFLEDVHGDEIDDVAYFTVAPIKRRTTDDRIKF